MGGNGQVVGDINHYGDKIYTDEAMKIIGEHDIGIPLFFYIAFQCNHEPLEAPDEYIEMYPSSWREDRRWYAAMTSYWDASLGASLLQPPPLLPPPPPAAAAAAAAAALFSSVCYAVAL